MNENDRYIGNMLDGRYEIVDVLGEGGMAVVYKALDHRLNRYVAIKIMRDEMAMDEEFRHRFAAEAHAVAMLSHSNIVAVLDVSHNDDLEYIVMELVDGITLREYIDRRGAIGWQEAVHYSKQIAKALSHAHQHGIIHRDIKPQNIMLLRDGTVKVGDFGIAALENELELYENDGQAVGSIHYIAPEQARGECPDARSDIYSLGVVMYEMLTGRQPFTGYTLGEIAVKHMNADAVPLHELVPGTPAELERIVFKAMSSKLKDRYQTAAELYNDLEAFTQAQQKEEGEEKYENPAVIPVRSVSEMSKSAYKRRRRRSARVSYLLGTFGLILLAVALFSALWNFWLREIFLPAERIELPNFVGTNYEYVINNPDLSSRYNFKVVYIIDTDTESGLVLSQSPEAGRSMMISSDGIDVELTVSTGMTLSAVPSVVNMDYREAMLTLTQAGFYVEVENETSDSVTRDYVISMSPSAGEQLSAGSTVYITVSAGPEISYVSVPNLVGISEEAAIAKLESAGLSYGGSERKSSAMNPGIVIGQSVKAFTEVEQHTKIYLEISTGQDG